MKKFWILQGLPKYDNREVWANTIGKMAPVDLLIARLPQTFSLWETQYLWNAVKQSTTKQGMPVFQR